MNEPAERQPGVRPDASENALERVTVVIGSGGEVAAVYDDRLATVFAALGPARTRRAGHVEPTSWRSRLQSWLVDLSPLGGSVNNGPFTSIYEALRFERRCVLGWLRGGGAFTKIQEEVPDAAGVPGVLQVTGGVADG